MEIRYLAWRSKSVGDPEDALARIHMIADACHNLPGSGEIRPRSAYDRDPLVYLWQTATASQRQWLTSRFESLGVDYSYLRDSAPWPPPARVPAMRPRLRRGGWRFPRGLHEFAELDTASLRGLMLEAVDLEPPGRKRPDYMLAHLDPDGRHLVRASRADENLFLPQGPGDLRQYRGLLQMVDGSVVVGHLRLRASSFAVLPQRLNMVKRLSLGATVPQRGERDVYLWSRDHEAGDPQCRRCTELAQQQSGQG